MATPAASFIDLSKIKTLADFKNSIMEGFPEDSKWIMELIPTEIPKEEIVTTDYTEEQIFKSEIEQLEYITDNILEVKSRMELVYLKLINFPNTARLLEPLAILSDILLSGQISPLINQDEYNSINSDITILNGAIEQVLIDIADNKGTDINPEQENIKTVIENTKNLYKLYFDKGIKFVLRRDARALLSSLPESSISQMFSPASILKASIVPISPVATAPAPAPAPSSVTAPVPAPAPSNVTAPVPAPAPSNVTVPAPAPAPSNVTAPAPVPVSAPLSVVPTTKGGKSRSHRKPHYRRTQKKHRK